MRAFLLIALLGLVTVGCGDANPAAPSAQAAPGGKTDSSSGFPPGQFPSGNPAQAPGCSNPNTTPSSDCKK